MGPKLRLRALALASLLATTAPSLLACHREAGRGAREPAERGDVERLEPIAPTEDVGRGPYVDAGAFRARFPEGFPEPKRNLRKLKRGAAVAFVSSSNGAVCLAMGAEQQRDDTADAQGALRGFEVGLVGEHGRLEGEARFSFRGLPALHATFSGRDDDGHPTYWRFLAIASGRRLFATVFMSKDEQARWSPAIDAFLGSLRVGAGDVPAAPPEAPESAPEGGEQKI